MRGGAAHSGNRAPSVAPRKNRKEVIWLVVSMLLSGLLNMAMENYNFKDEIRYNTGK